MKRTAAPSSERVNRFVAEVAAQTGLSVTDIRGRCRKPELSRARWRVWKRLYDLGFAKAAIAYSWGCNHASVYHGLKTLEQEAA